MIKQIWNVSDDEKNRILNLFDDNGYNYQEKEYFVNEEKKSRNKICSEITKKYEIWEKNMEIIIKIQNEINNMDDLLMLPMKERSVEKYINPFKVDWEYRYYKALFDVEITDDRKKQICVNYLEGLEWTFSYYIEGCIDWRWCYNYHYAPLFKDLLKYIPQMDTQFLKRQEKQMIEDLVQLCYVLPRSNLNLLPVEVNIVLMQKLGHLYGDDYEFKWAYCRYFWESHADLPRLHIETLEDIVNKAKNKKRPSFVWAFISLRK